MHYIEVQDLHRSFTEGTISHRVLDGLDLSIDEGELVILLGRSGSGKSTLLNLLSGIDTPDSGRIFIDSTELTALKEPHRTIFRRKNVGFVFQFFNLIPTLTVMENLKLALELTDKMTREDLERAEFLLSEVGLANRADTYPDLLSGGEQQRVAIARALVHDPKIILADEPTGNLDYQTADKVIELLDTLVKKAGKTMVMATHSRDLLGLADKIIEFKGRETVISGATGA
ncbi:MAG: ABC transporter ATP-binding protein [Ignavibacteriaceae bacterium]|nr:MAG: ABC transporter ATP-binding protein [Chlorobiota bacterium]GJQ31640.1 MAG: ABC transporter ATP-binding protein [Ignavibacteriaceae bacterium]